MTFDRKEWVRTLGWLGVALLVAGFIRYTIQRQLHPMSDVLLIAGAVLWLAWLVLGFPDILERLSKRSSKLGLNSAVLTLAVIVILGVINFLGFRHHKQWDLTSEKLYTLSDQTKKIIQPLKAGVDVLLFSKTPDPQLQALMEEYENLSSHIHYRVVDPQERPDLAKKYSVARMGQVIVASGGRIERVGGEFGETVGEQDVTSAILKATSNSTKTVCFVEGHGEKSITAPDAQGYSGVAGELKKENYQVQAVNLVTSGGVPAGCSVLVDAGPTEAFFPQEADEVKRYLDGGGKAMLLIDPDTDPKLDEVLSEWNVNVGDNYVIDASGVGRYFRMGPAAPLVVSYGASPIVRGFARTMTFFPLARTVSIADESKLEPQAVELLKTTALSYTKPSLVAARTPFNPKEDQRGPLSLGVAAERKSGATDARLVVIGNSLFAANQFVGVQRNGDLFFNAINWLSEEENLISIRPKSPANRRVNLTDAQRSGFYWFSVVLMPALVIFSGIFIWARRR